MSDDWFLKSSVSYRNIIVGIRHYDQSSLDLWLIKFVMEISNISISFDCNKKRTSVNLVLN